MLFASAVSWSCSSSGSSSNGDAGSKDDAGPTNEAGSGGTDASSGSPTEAGAGTSLEAGASCAVVAAGCPTAGCKVFETVMGNFQPGSGVTLATADQSCQSEAATRGLSGTFKAWLSTKACSAATRFAHNAVPYVSVDNQNVTIAANWTKLVSGTLAAAISPHGYPSVATGTNPDGTVAPLNCQDWSSSGAAENVMYPGDPTATGGGWTFAAQAFMSCSNAYALYCFEQ